MSSPPPRASVEVRRANAGDLTAMVDLLRRRDDRHHPAEAVTKYLLDADPQQLTAWLAMVDGKPAALNTIYLRDLSGNGRSIRAGYWAHLYVDPEHRKAMLYPQLVAAMLRGARELPLDIVYTATRRQQVADSHIKLGFQLLGTLSVKMKLLRPARLVIKHWEWPRPMERLSLPLDVAWRGGQRFRHRSSPNAVVIEPLTWQSPDLEEVVAMLNSAAGNRVHILWAVEAFRRRFANTIEGWPYFLLVAREPVTRSIVAAALVRIGERGPRAIRVAVLMDLIALPTHRAIIPLLLRDIDSYARENEADALLALDGAGSDFSAQLANWGYRGSPETYNLLVWPKAKMAPEFFAGQIQNWRFTFADHDAF